MQNNQNPMASTMEKPTSNGMLTGMFTDRESTENAYNSLHERGYTKDDINLVMSDDTRKNLNSSSKCEKLA